MFFESTPQYKRISKKQYEAAYRKYRQEGDFLWKFRFNIDYHKKTIYAPFSGIMAIINGTAKIIGYEYYKYIGTERTLLYGASEEKLVKELFKPTNDR